MKATLWVCERDEKKGDINKTCIASLISYLRSLTEIHLLPFSEEEKRRREDIPVSVVVVCLLLFSKCV
jgi:hypothetical protein